MTCCLCVMGYKTDSITPSDKRNQVFPQVLISPKNIKFHLVRWLDDVKCNLGIGARFLCEPTTQLSLGEVSPMQWKSISGEKLGNPDEISKRHRSLYLQILTIILSYNLVQPSCQKLKWFFLFWRGGGKGLLLCISILYY